MSTLQPAYLLRQPEAKRQAWRELLQLKAALDATTEGKLS
jgi:uracil-DNA glycosylase